MKLVRGSALADLCTLQAEQWPSQTYSHDSQPCRQPRPRPSLDRRSSSLRPQPTNPHPRPSRSQTRSSSSRAKLRSHSAPYSPRHRPRSPSRCQMPRRHPHLLSPTSSSRASTTAASLSASQRRAHSLLVQPLMHPADSRCPPPQSDPVHLLLDHYVPPDRRPRRDLSGDYRDKTLDDLVVRPSSSSSRSDRTGLTLDRAEHAQLARRRPLRLRPGHPGAARPHNAHPHGPSTLSLMICVLDECLRSSRPAALGFALPRPPPPSTRRRPLRRALGRHLAPPAPTLPPFPFDRLSPSSFPPGHPLRAPPPLRRAPLARPSGT